LEHRTADDAEIDADRGDTRRECKRRDSEFCRYSVEQQQAALGTGIPEADTGR